MLALVLRSQWEDPWVILRRSTLSFTQFTNLRPLHAAPILLDDILSETKKKEKVVQVTAGFEPRSIWTNGQRSAIWPRATSALFKKVLTFRSFWSIFVFFSLKPKKIIWKVNCANFSTNDGLRKITFFFFFFVRLKRRWKKIKFENGREKEKESGARKWENARERGKETRECLAAHGIFLKRYWSEKDTTRWRERMKEWENILKSETQRGKWEDCEKKKKEFCPQDRKRERKRGKEGKSENENESIR